MRLPEFTAEAAAYKTKKHYHAGVSQAGGVGSQVVVPQIFAVGFTIFGRRCFSIDYYECGDDCIAAGGSFDDCCDWLGSDFYCQ